MKPGRTRLRMKCVATDNGASPQTGEAQRAAAPGRRLLLSTAVVCLLASLVSLGACGGGASPSAQTQGPGDFQFSATSLLPATISAGSKATSTITITQENGFNGSVTFACSGLPGTVTCSFSPSSTTGSGTSQLTVATTAAIPPGRYAFSVSASSSIGNQSAELALGVAQPDGLITPIYFGIHGHNVNDPDWTQVAPFGALRLWGTGTSWVNLQPTNGAFDWKRLDNWMSAIQANGITHVLFELSGTARWASSDPNDTSAVCDFSDQDPPTNYGFCAPPSDLNADGTGPDQYWRNWVAAVSQHLQSVGSADGIAIDSYEPWNEFTRQASNSKVGAAVSWEGNDQQLVRMVQDARCIIVGNLGGSQTMEASGGQTCEQVLQSVNLSAPVDPSALFLSPSTGIGQTTKYLAAWDSYMSTPGAADASDGYAFHPYKTNPDMPLESEMLPLLLEFESDPTVTKGVQQGKPIWVTEGSWNTNADLPDPDDQAAYVAREYLLLFSVANIQRFYWYSLDQVCQTLGCDNVSNAQGGGTLLIPSGQAGCTNPNGCIQEAGVAYGQVYKWMAGTSQTTPCTNSQGTIWTCVFTRSSPAGYQAEAIWDTSQTCSNGVCTTTPVPVSSVYVQYRDLAGNVTAIVNNTVPVGEKPILLEN